MDTSHPSDNHNVSAAIVERTTLRTYVTFAIS